MTTPVNSLVILWVCIISAAYRPALEDFRQGGIAGLLSEGFGANYIVWFAIFVATLSIRKFKSGCPPILLIAAVILMVIPLATLSWIAASLIAFGLCLRNQGHVASVLLLVATLREPLTALCLKLFAGNILGVDALMTNAALMVMGKSTLIQSNIVMTESGQPLLILTGCSVFANLSYISLLWLSLHVFYQQTITRLSWVILLITIILTLASNAFRLALMTGSEKDYLFYHDGMGAQVFEWGLMGIVLCIVMGGCRYERNC